MFIDKLAAALPSRRVSNADVIEEIARHSNNSSSDFARLLKVIERTLESIGTCERRWLAEDEHPFNLTVQACRKAMDAIKEGPDIDLVIYASVYSDVVEPAAANMVAHALGLDGTEAFDMKAACDGWMKAMKIADSCLRTGTFKRILIVNAEFSMVSNYALHPHLFNLKDPEELKWRLPAYTIGEGAGATIVSGSPDDPPWGFACLTRNDLSDLCSVMSKFYRPARGASKRLAKDGPGWFTSWAGELSKAGIPLAIDTFKASGINPADIDLLFTHASGSKDWMRIAQEIGLEDKIVDIHPCFGNLVSASVPVALAIAEQEGRLKRGDRIAFLVASAGMTASAASTIF